MKDFRDQLQKEKIGGKKNGFARLFFGIGSAAAIGLSFLLNRKNPLSIAITNTTGPAASVGISAAILGDGVVGSIVAHTINKKYRKNAETIVKNLGVVQNYYKPGQNTENKKASDTLDVTKRSSENYFEKILKDRVYTNPNTFQQKVLNKLTFRLIDSSLPKEQDYSLSKVYDALRIKKQLADYNTDLNPRKKAEIDKKLSSYSLPSDEAFNKLNDDLEEYLSPLGDKTDFLKEYLMIGGDYKNFANIINEPKFKELLLARDTKEKAEAKRKEEPVPASYSANITALANKIIDEQKELNLNESQLYNLRRVFKKKLSYAPEYIREIENPTLSEKVDINGKERIQIGQNTWKNLERLAIEKRFEELKPKISNYYISPEWCRDVLLSSANDRLAKRQKQLVFDVAKECGIVGAELKNLKKATNADNKDSNLIKNALVNLKNNSTFTAIQKGLILDSKKAEEAKANGIKKQYLVTDNYRLKKFSTYKYGAHKAALKMLPEYRRSTWKNNLFPLTTAFMKKGGFLNIVSLFLSATLLVAAITTGVGLLSAIGLGVTGAALGAVTLANRVITSKTGKRFFVFKGQKYNDKNKFNEEERVGRRLAPARCDVSNRFSNAIIENNNEKIVGVLKRIANTFGGNLKPKNFGAGNVSNPEKLPNCFSEIHGEISPELKEKMQKHLIKTVKNGIETNSEVRFLTDPMEIYIKDTKGKIKTAFCIDQKDIAEGMLPEILKEYLKPNDKNSFVDVFVGKTTMRIHPSEIANINEINNLNKVCGNIMSFCNEEQSIRVIPNLTEYITNNPDLFDIALNGENIVAKGHRLASIVNFNLERQNKKSFFHVDKFSSVKDALKDKEESNKAFNKRKSVKKEETKTGSNSSTDIFDLSELGSDLVQTVTKTETLLLGDQNKDEIAEKENAAKEKAKQVAKENVKKEAERAAKEDEQVAKENARKKAQKIESKERYDLIAKYLGAIKQSVGDDHKGLDSLRENITATIEAIQNICDSINKNILSLDIDVKKIEKEIKTHRLLMVINGTLKITEKDVNQVAISVIDSIKTGTKEIIDLMQVQKAVIEETYANIKTNELLDKEIKAFYTDLSGSKKLIKRANNKAITDFKDGLNSLARSEENNEEKFAELLIKNMDQENLNDNAKKKAVEVYLPELKAIVEARKKLNKQLKSLSNEIGTSINKIHFNL